MNNANSPHVLDQKSGREFPRPKAAASMRMTWHDLLFMHWPVEPSQLTRWLPQDLALDTWEGQAWISVVPFHMSGVAPRWFPGVPWMSSFPELNVRTYVIRDDKPGVWFFSLDATNPIAVRVARKLFHLNYIDARINIDQNGNWCQYYSERTDRKQNPAILNVDYRPVGFTFTAEPGTLEAWLTARYRLYTSNRAGKLFRGEIDHAPWQLQNAQIVLHANTMLDGYELDISNEPSLLQFAKRTDVVAWSLQSA